jgi:hypothetical protein
MPTCFVIQPFDNGKYDKRFEDVFKPAVEAAALDAYRVERERSVDVPVDAIEEAIRNAAVCLAEITVDNPNVWYELGYAFARGQPIAMVCSNERQKFPFDIQHRSLIIYVSESPRDFEALRTSFAAMSQAQADNDLTDTRSKFFDRGNDRLEGDCRGFHKRPVDRNARRRVRFGRLSHHHGIDSYCNDFRAASSALALVLAVPIRSCAIFMPIKPPAT